MSVLRKELLKEIKIVVEQVSDIIQSLPDTAVPSNNKKWTVGDTAAHLVISQQLFNAVFQGGENPYKVGQRDPIAEVNDELLANFHERNGTILAKQLLKEAHLFLKTTDKFSDTYPIKTHFGSINLLTGLSYNLCHLLIHGCSLAVAFKKPLPLRRKHIKLVNYFLKQAMLYTYDKKAAGNIQATFAIHFRSIPGYAIILDHDRIKVSDTFPLTIDCHISADPVTYFLVSTGIIGQWKPLFRGKFMVWGRKPWLALTLPTLFKNP